MRRSLRAVAATFVMLSSVTPALVRAEHGSAGEGHGAAEGGAEHHGVPEACPSELTAAADHECFEYWENHINWFSFDYKPGKNQQPEHRHMPPPFSFALINFAVFLLVMRKLAAAPLADFVRTRHSTIRKDLDEAQALHRQAEGRLREYEGKIAGLDREIDSLLAQVKQEAQSEKARIVAEAEKQAAHLKLEAEAQIQVELRRMRAALKTEAVTAAIAAAEQLLRTASTVEDQSRLAERFVHEIERPAPATSRSPQRV